MSEPRKIVLLGATGSIGKSTLQVIRKHRDRLKLIGISAKSQSTKLADIASEFEVGHACICESCDQNDTFPENTILHQDEKDLETLASLPEADIVVIAIVGASGLKPTLSALRAGKDVVLANKESLVLGGSLVMETAKASGAKIIPADSEHNAIFQCIQGQNPQDLDSVVLTASGGPFRDFPVDQLKDVSVEETLNHPNWSMGPKITVDSATMANKGLELIEASWLFNLPPKKLEVVIHPPSLIHALVRLVDGCCLAQLSPPSMTFALQHALLYPERNAGVHPSIDFSQPLDLSFYPPDLSRYPCLKLAQDALSRGDSAPLVFNAANEIAVDAFLTNRIGFTQISSIIEKTLATFEHQPTSSLDSLLDCDLSARRIAGGLISGSP